MFKPKLNWNNLEDSSNWPKSVKYAVKLDDRYQAEVRGGKLNVMTLYVFDHDHKNRFIGKSLVIIYPRDISDGRITKETAIQEIIDKTKHIVENPIKLY